MATLHNIGKLKYRGKDGQWHPLPVVVQDAGGGVSTISGKGQPTESTVGRLNQLYRDESTDKLYICTGDDGGYTWAAVSGGSVDVDATLTKAEYAADAKAAGDAIGKKLDKTALPTAINDALAQAKASGEFDGAKGDKGDKGDPGAQGIHGEKGDTGPAGPKGADGKDGAGMDVTGAKVGQIAKITAVDAQGKPTGWEAVDMPSDGTYTLPTASPTVLGGVQPIAKTDAMTQSVGVDDAGALFTLPGGGSGEKPWRILRDIMITETVTDQTQNVTYYTNDIGKVRAIEFSVDEDGAAFSVSEIVVIGIIENLETTGTGCGYGIFKGSYLSNKDITYIREGLLTGKKQTIYVHSHNLFGKYTMAEFYNFQQYQKSGFQGSWNNISGWEAFNNKLLNGWKEQAAPPWTQLAFGTSGQGMNGRVVFFAR